MIETLPHDQFVRITVTLWAIWTSRRKAIHEDIFQSPLSTYAFVNVFLSELKQIAKPSARQGDQNKTLRDPKWIPPPSNMAKMNVDAVVSKIGNKGAALAFCRDSGGNYLGSSAVIFSGIIDPTVLETLACREALTLAGDLVQSRVLVASNCKPVVEDIMEGTMGRYGAIVSEIRVRAAQMNECKFVFEGRASNFEAHNLARFMLSFGVGGYVWLGTPHDVNIPVNILAN
jgi:hypothetical protein